MAPPKTDNTKQYIFRNGSYGEYGLGQGTKVFYMQVAFMPQDLDKICLIGDIKGSEKWSVPDLFQREVDERRVNHEILPYLENENLIKYFSPLTLTLLPIRDDKSGSSVVKEIPLLTEKEEKEDGETWVVFEAESLYKFRYVKDKPYYAEVSWNGSKVKPVAVDGQHRLSALKKRYNDSRGDGQWDDFASWSIPAVIFGLKSVDNNSSPSILEVVRNIFIYINKEAKAPTKNRNILLSDNSVNCILSQEILEISHQNDVKEPKERNKDITPLLFYGWREDQIQSSASNRSAAHVKTVEEIYGLISHFLIGEDFSPDQLSNLNITPTHELYKPIHDKNFTSETLNKIRSHLKGDILKGITHFFINFKPYKVYTEKLRLLENQKTSESALANHAFSRLRFGVDHGLDSDKDAIDFEYKNIIADILRDKSQIPDFIDMDICLRGILCAFGKLRIIFNDDKSNESWLVFSKWFTKIINLAFDDQWFADDMHDTKYKMYRHITYDHNENTQNYRFGDVPTALGSFMTLLLGAYGKKHTDFPSEDTWNDIQKELLDSLSNTLEKGYRREAKVILQSNPEILASELNSKVKKEAEKMAKNQMKKIETLLNKISL